MECFLPRKKYMEKIEIIMCQLRKATMLSSYCALQTEVASDLKVQVHVPEEFCL